MSVYTIVNDDYEVEVFTCSKKLVERLHGRGVKYFDCHEDSEGNRFFQPDTNITARIIRNKRIVNAYIESDSGDWEYKIQSH